jgi:hypothetical protein
MFLYQLDRIRRGLPREDNELNKMETVTPAELKFNGAYEAVLGKPLAEASLKETIQVRARAQAAIARAAPGLIILKSHYVLGVIDGAPTINADVSAGAVYLVRDPRDVALSLANHMSCPVDEAIQMLNTNDVLTVTESKTNVDEIWGSWSQNVESWTSGADDSLLTVRYEDMLSNPVEVFGKVVAHLRKTATPEQIVEAARLSAFDEMRRQEDEFGYNDKPVMTEHFFLEGKAGRWRDKLTPAQVEAIVAANGRTMTHFGYLN